MAKNNRTVDRIQAVWNKLGGEDGVDRLLRGELVVVSTPPEFSIWKTIKLGTGLRTADEFRKALSDGGYCIRGYGNDILGEPAFTASETEMDVDLVNVSVADLGFKDGAYCREIIAKALELGLELCPAEVGPQLRLQYADQPKREYLNVGVKPITDTDSCPLHDIGHGDDGRWFDGDYGDGPEDFFLVGGRFVFVRPRNK